MYALCDCERYSSTFGIIRVKVALDRIFRIIGQRCFTGPFTLLGFGSETRMPIPVSSNWCFSNVVLIIYWLLFLEVHQDHI